MQCMIWYAFFYATRSDKVNGLGLKQLYENDFKLSRPSEMPFCVMFCTYRLHPSRFLTVSWHFQVIMMSHALCNIFATHTVCCGHWSWQQKKIASVWPILMTPCFKHPTQLIAVKVSITLSKHLFYSANVPHRQTVDSLPNNIGIHSLTVMFKMSTQVIWIFQKRRTLYQLSVWRKK